MSRKMFYAVVALFVVLLLLGTVIAVLLDHLQFAVVGVAALLATACLMLLELRRNTRDVAHTSRELNRKLDQLVEAAPRSARRLDFKAVERRLEDLADRVGAENRAKEKLSEDLGQGIQANLRLLQDEATKSKKFHSYMRAQMRGLPRSLVQQIEAQMQLHERFDPRAPFLAADGWALAPTVTIEIVDVVARQRPELVVECGSGLSTVWLAYALRENGSGRLVALEHDERYLAQTRSMLERHGLTDVAEIRHAPLHPVPVRQDEMLWYSAPMDDLSDIGVLLVDGPPASTGTHARYPAVPLLRDRMAAGATIILDDASRAEERAVLARWLDEDDSLRLDTELPGGAAILRTR